MMQAKGLPGLYRGVGPELLKRRDMGRVAALDLREGGHNQGRYGEVEAGGIQGLDLLENGKEKGKGDGQKRASTGTVRVTLVKKMKRTGKRGIWWKICIGMIPVAGLVSRPMVMTSTSAMAMRTRNLRPIGWNRRREYHCDSNETSEAWKGEIPGGVRMMEEKTEVYTQA